MMLLSPSAIWRIKYGMTVEELAETVGVETQRTQAIEAGEHGLIGEVQDYLVQQGENVSDFASRQSTFITACQSK